MGSELRPTLVVEEINSVVRGIIHLVSKVLNGKFMFQNIVSNSKLFLLRPEMAYMQLLRI